MKVLALLCLLIPCTVFPQTSPRPSDLASTNALKALFRELGGERFDLRAVYDHYESPNQYPKPKSAWRMIKGRVLSVTKTGLLVKAERLDPDIIHLCNAPLTDAFDGMQISKLAAYVGTYAYMSAGGAKKTVPEFDYGKLDEKGFADFIAQRAQDQRSKAEAAAKAKSEQEAKRRLQMQAAEERAAAFHEARAKDGSDASQFEIGIRYLEGRGVQANRDKAIKWLSLAAEAGNKQAKMKLEEIRQK